MAVDTTCTCCSRHLCNDIVCSLATRYQEYMTEYIYTQKRAYFHHRCALRLYYTSQRIFFYLHVSPDDNSHVHVVPMANELAG